jgi:hypothetical protein
MRRVKVFRFCSHWGASAHPFFDLGVFVGAVVVGDQMERQIVRSLSVQLLEEGQPLPVSVLGGRGAEYLAIQIR